ncbi:unnamed protein product [Pylaiella littoralis]
MSKTLVFDNGAGGLKAGFAGQPKPAHIMPNCTGKIKGQAQMAVGDETTHAARDSAPISILRPFDRGYVTNWEPEFEVWRRMLSKNFLNADPRDSRLLATEAPFGPLVLQEAANEVVFEEFGFAACYRCPSAALSCYREQMLEEERESILKAKMKKRQAELNALHAREAREALEKARADEEAARAAAVAKAAHGRGTRLTTGALVGGGNTRQRYDPTDPDGVMGQAYSKRRKRASPSSSPSPGGSGPSSRGGTKSGFSVGDGPKEEEDDDDGRKQEEEEDEDKSEEEKEEEEVWETEEDVRLEELDSGGAASADLLLLGGGLGKGAAMSDVCIVVDSGFSFTHILPFYQGRALHKSALRLNVGGKLLTNYLKEVISYRQWNMMDEFEIMQDAKDSLSYVSLDLDADLKAARTVRPGNPIVREFVLPDRKNVMKGYAREVDWDARVKRRQQEDLGVEDEQQPQILTMGNERFHTPEVLFHPSNIGLSQMGLSEAVATCIERCPAALRPQFYANVLLTGGNCAIPNLKERLYRDLRVSAPIHCEVNVTLPDEPMLHAWRGGSRFGASPEFGSFAVSKQEYDEFGHTICKIRYADW